MKASLKATASKRLAEKENFIHAKDDSGTEVKTKTIEKVKVQKTMKVETNKIKKASSYIPHDLWIKYKRYELAQAEKGINVSLNGLLVELLEKKLREQ